MQLVFDENRSVADGAQRRIYDFPGAFDSLGQNVTPNRFERIDARTVELQPVSTNPEHQPIEIGPTTEDMETVGIVGIVVEAIVATRRGTH